MAYKAGTLDFQPPFHGAAWQEGILQCSGNNKAAAHGAAGDQADPGVAAVAATTMAVAAILGADAPEAVAAVSLRPILRNYSGAVRAR